MTTMIHYLPFGTAMFTVIVAVAFFGLGLVCAWNLYVTWENYVLDQLYVVEEMQHTIISVEYYLVCCGVVRDTVTC